MKFFLDTANLEDIARLAAWGVLDGVTTNPSLLAKEGVKNKDVEKHLKKIVELVDGPISMEVLALTTDKMVKEGLKYAAWSDNIVVKIPMTPEGLKAVKILHKDYGIPTNVTLCFSANQALLAAKAGATYISPFVGRIDDMGDNGLQVVKEIVTIYDHFHFNTDVLVASIRSAAHVRKAALLGADVCTVPPAVFEKLVSHPLTDRGLEKFLADWKGTKKK